MMEEITQEISELSTPFPGFQSHGSRFRGGIQISFNSLSGIQMYVKKTGYIAPKAFNSLSGILICNSHFFIFLFFPFQLPFRDSYTTPSSTLKSFTPFQLPFRDSQLGRGLRRRLGQDNFQLPFRDSDALLPPLYPYPLSYR